jgi:hypothetical protein
MRYPQDHIHPRLAPHPAPPFGVELNNRGCGWDRLRRRSRRLPGHAKMTASFSRRQQRGPNWPIVSRRGQCGICRRGVRDEAKATTSRTPYARHTHVDMACGVTLSSYTLAASTSYRCAGVRLAAASQVKPEPVPAPQRAIGIIRDRKHGRRLDGSWIKIPQERGDFTQLRERQEEEDLWAYVEGKIRLSLSCLVTNLAIVILTLRHHAVSIAILRLAVSPFACHLAPAGSSQRKSFELQLRRATHQWGQIPSRHSHNFRDHRVPRVHRHHISART